MERRRSLRLCSLGGGIALGAGIALWALCSPASVGCTTNIVVLTGGRITSKACAAYSVAAHAGVGLVVVGAVLLVGRFVLGRIDRAAGSAADIEAPAAGSGAAPDGPVEAPASTAAVGAPAAAVVAAVEVPGTPATNGNGSGHRPRLEPVGAAPSEGPPVELDAARARKRELPLVDLPPGWYGNPDNPGGSVQWWDGTRLLDERPGA
jgi:hypothetical protein